MKNNAFHILGVNPGSTRKEITNAREDVLFDGNFPEEVITKAESALIKSIPRLYEELTFLWGISPDLRNMALRDGDGKGLEELIAMLSFWNRDPHALVNYRKNEGGRRAQILMEGLREIPDITKANITAKYCLQHKKENSQQNALDVIEMLVDAQKCIDKDTIGDLINTARKESKVVPLIDGEHIADGLKKLRNEKFKKAIIHIITESPTKSHDILANIAKLAKCYQYDKSPAGRFFREFIYSDYKNWIQPRIEPIETKIKKAAEKLKESPGDNNALKTFEIELLQWDGYYRPVQLMEKARNYDQKKLNKFFRELQYLGGHLYKKGAPETALRVYKLFDQVFRELPQTSRLIKRNIYRLEKTIADQKNKELNKEFERVVEKIQFSSEFLHQEISQLLEIFSQIVKNDHFIRCTGQFPDDAFFSQDIRIWMFIRGIVVDNFNKDPNHESAENTLIAMRKLHTLATIYVGPLKIKHKLNKDISALKKNQSVNSSDSFIGTIIGCGIAVFVIFVIWLLSR